MTTLTKTIQKKLEETSRRFGVGEKDVVERALIFYLEHVDPAVKLKREMDEWDALSDEALVNFEKSLA